MTWFAERREMEKDNPGTLVKSIANAIQTIQNNRSRRYRCIPSTPVWYEVSSSETLKDYIVKLDSQTCNCREWQTKGYPCGHALAIILLRKETPATYTKPFFTLNAFRNTYASPIVHPHNDDFSGPLQYTASTHRLSDSEHSEDDEKSVLSPNTRRPPGRPKKRRIRHRLEQNGDTETRTQNQHCSRCKQAGHSKRTCRERI